MNGHKCEVWALAPVDEKHLSDAESRRRAELTRLHGHSFVAAPRSAGIAGRLSELRPVVDAASERQRWRRPRREVVEAAITETNELALRRQGVAEVRAPLAVRVARLTGDLAASEQAGERLPVLEAEQADREAWLRSGPPEVVWADELRRRIADRTTELGDVAVHDPPGHLLGILGPPGAALSTQQWAKVAGRLEGYRERWGIKPDQLRKPPPRLGAQAAHWRQIELALPEPVAQQAPTVERDIDHGVSL